MTLDELTQCLVASLETKVDRRTFESLIRPLVVSSLDDTAGAVTLVVPGEMARTRLNTKLRSALDESLLEHLGRPFAVTLEVGPTTAKPRRRTPAAEPAAGDPPHTPPAPPSVPPARTANDVDLHLIPSYTFDNFIVGNGNRLVHAASLAVSESPGKGNPYNPLYIYSDTGLGKTHLIHAIAHRIRQRRPDSVIRLLTAEMFMVEFIDIVHQRKPFSQFRQKYRGCDVLMVDDIQLIAGKDATEEEFFHTFNALYESGSQIIIASDKHPRDIPRFQERMATRLTWGLTADIQPPDFETRLAILRNKSELLGIQVKDEILALLAQRIKTNVRDLESALVKLSASTRLIGKDMGDYVEELLGELAPPTQISKKVDVQEILQTACEEFEIPLSLMKSNRRNKELILPRHVAMFLVREHTQLSFEEIGEAFGGRHYATIIKAVDKVRNNPSQESLGAIERIKTRLGLK